MGVVIISGESRADKLLGEFSIIKGEISLIDCESAAVIIGKNSGVEIRAALGVIVDGDEPWAELPRSVQLISCGVSSKNTVCVTSRTHEKITLSLNRTVKTASGICEPLEFPVNEDESISEYDKMAAFAVKILLNNSNSPR